MRYDSRPGWIGCHPSEPDIIQELLTEKLIREGDPQKYGISPTVKNLFAKMEPVLELDSEYYCLLYTWEESVSLKEYLKPLSNVAKDQLLPAIFMQVITALRYLDILGLTHDGINPENIMISRTFTKNVPTVTITDMHAVRGGLDYYDRKAIWSRNLRFRFLDTPCMRGYRPPEDYNTTLYLVDSAKRSSWELGATIYTALTDRPPYGATALPDNIPDWEDTALINTMLRLPVTGNTFPNVTTSHNLPLLQLMKTLMTCDSLARPTIGELDVELLKQLAASSDLRATALDQNLLSAWSLLKLAAATANPFSRYPPNST
ncbi:hypothetical protein THASP1DRAFT_31416 [Thamnocephalis sphaerospora]|uniref:Protein kinase domain-containing protein n=1 Tax=Thamnocephalis sphaerospora TaxID=78915 RepID=A0A4V1IW94_9FUNG|nr:hypothetical protein THASP1DRAFT_31416 [Thamnocephalis sphaerospora]|eukprot:RKP06769.1 hypothetical protein THASP1DRAFT_31416 [Thamnocephalis sphaerospora]